MKYAVRYSAFFFDDLAAVCDYLSQYSASASSRIKALLSKRVEQLKDMPESYAVYSFAPAYRRFVIDKYVAIYQVDPENRIVFMYRFLHGARDIAAYL